MLNELRIKNLKPKDKFYRITDSHGLRLEITPKGIKHWRYRYKFNGKETMLAMGKYPVVSLSEARKNRDSYRLLLDQGLNPNTVKNQEKIANIKRELESKSFSEIFYEWHNQNKTVWSLKHTNKVLKQYEKHLLPYVGKTNVIDLEPQNLLVVFRRIEANGTIKTLQKVKSHASRVFRYYVGIGIIKYDPTRDLPGNIFKKAKTNHYATITDPKEIGGLLRMIDVYQGSYQIETALKIAPYLFLRPNELAGLRWNEIDFNNKLIRISASRMKTNVSHIVPLCTQVVDLLKNIKTINSDSDFVFPSIRDKTRQISPESLRAGLRRIGLTKDEITTHGFRHMASTRLYEMGFKSDIIEHQLAHAECNKVKAAYNHAEYLDERTAMMQKWADYLGRLKKDM
ncbi:MAG: Integrase [Candidatus Ruthia sp. Asou_11_S2]|nr:Integrase [Candidatus Ruthia sp. Asou_11_S2]